MRWQPDPTFYPSPKMAMEAPAEKLAQDLSRWLDGLQGYTFSQDDRTSLLIKRV